MVSFGRRKLGDGHPCFITFEAGATHEGLEPAKELVSLSHEAGANAVKFQIFDPDRLVADKNQLFSYKVITCRENAEPVTVEEPLYDILCRRYLAPGQWKEIKELCDSLGLLFFATVGFEEDIKLLQELGCDSVKIASADINHRPLIRKAAKTGMCVQLDTGCATLGEIEKAVLLCIREGNKRIIIHNCPSGYPARIESINLNLITTLRQMFPEYPVAYSDHTPGWDMDIAAVALGAHLVEKTITLDLTARGPEHMFSLEPEKAGLFVRAVRTLETAMGSTTRILHPEEEKKRKAVRRSAYLKTDMKQGEKVFLTDVEFRRPGFGIPPDVFEALCGGRLTRDIEKGGMMVPGDLEKK